MIRLWHLVLAALVGGSCGAWCVATPPPPITAQQQDASADRMREEVRAALVDTGATIAANTAQLDAIQREMRSTREQLDDLRCGIEYQAERPKVRWRLPEHWSWSRAWGDWQQCERCAAGHACNKHDVGVASAQEQEEIWSEP